MNDPFNMNDPTAGNDGGEKKARIEIIPLIDVIFFLLATFVLFTLSLNKIKSLPTQLPYAGIPPDRDQPQPPDNTVKLQVSEEGACYWNRELITLKDLAPRLQQYIEKEPLPRVLIGSDDKAKYGTIALVLDEVRKAGIKQVAVETLTRPTGR
jgi:biopolymer transport protein ExbD